jgi:flagellar biosynthesis protein FliQ
MKISSEGAESWSQDVLNFVPELLRLFHVLAINDKFLGRQMSHLLQE